MTDSNIDDFRSLFKNVFRSSLRAFVLTIQLLELWGVSFEASLLIEKQSSEVQGTPHKVHKETLGYQVGNACTTNGHAFISVPLYQNRARSTAPLGLLSWAACSYLL